MMANISDPSFESLARIIVSGFLLDPETKASSWRLSLNDIPKWFTLAPPPAPVPQPSSTSLEKLPQPSASSSMPNLTPPQPGTNPSTPSLLSQKSSSSTPFALAIAKQRSLAEESRPYLRHSWNRIDFLAVCSFWAMFVLATLGIEKTSTLHISVFRALSVLRTTRLLAVTHGTTVRLFAASSATLWLMVFKDYHALPQDGRPPPRQCGLIFVICHRIILVSWPSASTPFSAHAIV